MRSLYLALAFAVAPVLAHAADGMCTASETVFFSCQTTRAKSVSLCGVGLGHLQYRFGKPGKPEFSFPSDGKDGARRMRIAHYFRHQVDRIEISFSNQGNDYALYDYTENGKRSAGVRVLTTARKEVDIACVKPVRSRLGELDSVLACDADNALNMGDCPTK